MVIIDGTTYNVRVRFDTLKRSFSVVEGRNSGTSISGKAIRDITGTAFEYAMSVEPLPGNAADYDALYEVISDTSVYHTVTVPYAQTTQTFKAYVSGASDSLNGKIAGRYRWHGMTITFKPYEVQAV